MPGSAAQRHDEMVRAYDAQRSRLRMQGGDDRWSASAQRFRLDPRRPMDALLSGIGAFIETGDVLLDVGGGAGRLSLPFADRCKEIVDIEPSQGMGEAFLASATEAGIANARLITADWLGAPPVEGDVSLVANVTYFVPEIVPFVERLVLASRRRVIIAVASTPPPNQGAALFRVVNGHDQALVPGHSELLPVLWEMGVLPDVRVLAAPGRGTAILGRSHPTREATIESALGADAPENDAGREAARQRVEAAFDELFERTGEVYRLRLVPEPRVMLITWEPGA